MNKDFILDNNSLQIRYDDFVINNSDNQNCSLIIQYHPGHLKSEPTLGVGIDNMILGQITAEMRKIISRELSNDGYKLKQLTFDENGTLQIGI